MLRCRFRAGQGRSVRSAASNLGREAACAARYASTRRSLRDPRLRTSGWTARAFTAERTIARERGLGGEGGVGGHLADEPADLEGQSPLRDRLPARLRRTAPASPRRRRSGRSSDLALVRQVQDEPPRGLVEERRGQIWTAKSPCSSLARAMDGTRELGVGLRAVARDDVGQDRHDLLGPRAPGRPLLRKHLVVEEEVLQVLAGDVAQDAEQANDVPGLLVGLQSSRGRARPDVSHSSAVTSPPATRTARVNVMWLVPHVSSSTSAGVHAHQLAR